MRAYFGIIEAASVVALLLGLFLLGHHFGAKSVQAKWNIEKLAQVEATAAADHENRVIESRYQSTVAKAQNEQTIRNQKLQVAATTARTESNGLRSDIATIRSQLPNLAADAIRQRADTLGSLFSECSADYAKLAGTADALSSDRQTLIDAWPK